MKNKHFFYKGYTGTVEYNEVDNCLFGKVIGLSKTALLYQGSSVAELEQDFIDVIDEYLEFCEEQGFEPQKTFSGKLNIRLTPELHYTVATQAASIGDSINSFIIRALKNELQTN